MSGTGWALQKAVFAHLAQDAGVKSLLGDPPRIYDGAPAGGVNPYVMFGDWREAPLAGVEGAFEHDFRLIIRSRHDGRREIKAIAVALHDALQDAALTLDNAVLVSLCVVFTDVIYRNEPDRHVGVMRFRALTQSL